MAGTIKYIAGDGTGDYNCSGSGDQTVINQALSWANANPGNRIHLKGNFTYDITGQILIGSSTIFSGDSTAKLRLNNSCLWSKIPVITSITSAIPIHDVEIYGFNIDLNEANLYHAGTDRIHGHGYYNAIQIKGASLSNPAYNIKIHDLYVHDGLGDGIRLEWVKNVKVYDNDLRDLMHSSIFIIESIGLETYDNYIETITTSGIRHDNCRDAKIHDNTIKDFSGTTHAPKYGAHGIQFGNQPASSNRTQTTNNLEIYNNDISVGGCGFQIEDYVKNSSAQTVRIYNNKIHGCGYTTWADYFSGICIYCWGNGLTIENNTLDHNSRAGILVWAGNSSGVKTTVRNNNIINSITNAGNGAGGWGIWNKVSTTLTIVAENNYVNNNVAGKYSGVTPVSESSSAITTSTPGGSTTTDDDTSTGDDTTDIGDGDTGGGSVYIPPLVTIVNDEDQYFEREPYSAYINGVEFYWQQFKGSSAKVLGVSKSPSVPGWNITDMNLEGGNVSFECIAPDMDNIRKVLASFYRQGRSTIYLGGPYDGYKITGTGDSHSCSIDLKSDVPERAHPYTLTFFTDKPIMEWANQRVRSRYIYESGNFSSDDCYAGNIVKNQSFEEWLPNSSLSWSLQNTVGDNTWRNVKYAKEINQFCAVAESGTDTRIMIKNSGENWRLPTGIASLANRNNNWRGLVWCPDWGIWVATAVSGTTGYYCATSADGDNWTQKATPADNAWGQGVWIPPNDIIPNGRVLFVSYSGTNRVMYSDDQCASWTTVASALESNNWLSVCYNEELNRLVAVAYTGSGTQRVMYSDDYGATWTAVNSPAQKWTSVIFSALTGKFIAISEDDPNHSSSVATTQQCMTSADGLTWTLIDTPYASSTTSETGGSVVGTHPDSSPSGYYYTTLATSYAGSNGYASLMYTFVLPALSSGQVYRIDSLGCKMRIANASYMASAKVTVQAASINGGVETDLTEWTERTTTYTPKTYNLALESATNETVTLKFYVKTSNGSYRAGITDMTYNASILSAAGSSISYTRNAWRSLVEAPEIGLIVAVPQYLSGVPSKVMYTTNAVTWNLIPSATRTTDSDNSWLAIAYGDNKFEAVGNAGTGQRAMISEGYGQLMNVAPQNWTLEETGQSRSDTFAIDGLYSMKISGDGVKSEPGKISQVIGLDGSYDAGVRYVLSAQGVLDGLTSGSYRVDIFANSTVIKELIWNTNSIDWNQKQIFFKFDTVPDKVYVRVHGSGTPNSGSVFYCDDIIVSKASDFEIASSGSDIATYGYYDVIPNVTVRGVGVTQSSPSTTRTVPFVTPSDDFWSSVSKVYTNTGDSLELTVPLPALSGGAMYKFTEFSYRLKSSNANVYAVMKVTIQSSGLFGGVETAIAEYSTKSTSYQKFTYTVPYNLQSVAGNAVTLRYYLRTSNASYRAYADQLGYKYTETIEQAAASSTSLSLYNIANPRRILKVCDVLPQGYMIEIKNDHTGSYRYVEDFDDASYVDNAHSITGTVSRNDVSKTLVMSKDSSIVFPFQTYYPVTGVPFLKMFVVSGSPQISIADDSGTNGAPGAWQSIDDNNSIDITNAPIEKELHNESSLKLRGKTKYYVKIAPKSGGTCEFGQLIEYAALDTMDAERFYLYATGKANTIGSIVGDGTNKCSMVVTLAYNDADILP